MRNTRFGALAASAALASTMVLGGAGIASAADDAEPAAVESKTINFEGHYELTGTAYDNCTVEFSLESTRDDDVTEYLRADYRVDGEGAIMDRSDQDVRPFVYRPAVVNHEDTKVAIDGRDNPYDVGAGTEVVDLTEERTVPVVDPPYDETRVLDGVAPNADGTHTIEFGVYQGSGLNASNKDLYETTEIITVEGCPIVEDEGLIGSVIGSVDVFGSLESVS